MQWKFYEDTDSSIESKAYLMENDGLDNGRG